MHIGRRDRSDHLISARPIEMQQGRSAIRLALLKGDVPDRRTLQLSHAYSFDVRFQGMAAELL